jgi:preprotein translocase subunit SecF
MVGLIAGTYSTVFVVGPMWYMTLKDKKRVRAHN